MVSSEAEETSENPKTEEIHENPKLEENHGIPKAEETSETPESEGKHENPETESTETREKLDISEGHVSPRGVFEIPISGGDSDQSSSSWSSENSTSQQALIQRIHHGLQWKNIKESLKKKSVRKLSSFHFLGNNKNSRKNMRRRLARIRSADDGIDCGGFPIPKPSWRNFDYDELAAATDNFSSVDGFAFLSLMGIYLYETMVDKLLGKGGHAEVYKGCLADGQLVAVKRLIKKEKEESERVGDFLSELGIIAHINHPNAARLLGFSTDGGLHLVLQFSPHGSLASVLHGSEESLDWETRFKVIVGIAEGLCYLHHGCQRRIIHRDIKASNILLTEDYVPQISDFGLAKWLPDKWAQHIVFPIEGTIGYLAPEYFMHGVVNEKTDVFAFGVLLLELITGRRAVDSCRQSLVMWAKPLLDKNSIKELVDPRLGDAYDLMEMKRATVTASMCIHHISTMRPHMNRVVQVLKGEGGSVEMKQKSNIAGRQLILDAFDLEDYTTSSYLKDLNRHMQLVLE
ncbi:Serine-threonine/tyrosine-protein kinase, catalytic domain [Dillenia turbinata]|uniref:non-specific serine/threonine protein kinase n=1 Tax=Dillenia turbinata TaxID=194707 RepID=A0AAN8V5M4_9MAGN